MKTSSGALLALASLLALARAATPSRTARAALAAQRAQLQPASALIRPIECRNANNASEAGICMFSIDCMHNKGVPLSVCKHNYFVGTCCRLPDHNNFVGIVYDLRDTETSQLLEARRVLPAELAASASGPAGAPPPPPPPPVPVPVVSVPAEPQQLPAAGGSLGRPLGDKYVIASSSLFGAAPQPPGVQQPLPVGAAEVAASAESARNVDGGQPAPVAVSLLVAALAATNGSLQPAAEFEGPQQQQQQQSSQLNKQPVPGYDLIREGTLAAPSSPEPLSRLAAGSNSSGGSSSLATHTTLTTAAPAITLAPEEPPAEAHSLPLATIVLANNHQRLTPIDAELAMGVGVAVQISNQGGAAASGSPVDLVSGAGPTTTPFTTSLSTALLPSVAVSGRNHAAAGAATTTPAPSTEPQTATIGLTGSSSTPSTTTTATPTTTTTTTSTTTTTTSNTVTTTTNTNTNTNTSSSSNNSTAGSQAEVGHEQHTLVSSPSMYAGAGTHQARPAASKIVSGSGAANQLIPGLSGLQSAILAHMPFKLASGLSSGLSSYLQAAMKPAAGSHPNTSGPSRPLLSSNTAPALPYQSTSAPSSSSSSPSSPPSPPASPQAPGGPQNSTGEVAATGSETAGSSAAAAAAASALYAAAGDASQAFEVFRRARRVCGRPHVASRGGSLPGLGESPRKRVARIVGGNRSAFGQWPWMVSLRQWRKGAFLHKCGAALLNENWAITAAHCVENVKPADLLLRLGEFDVSNQDEPFPFVERRVKQVVAHPQFDPKTFEYDLALMKFAEPVQYERNVIPVCVPRGNDTYVDRMATVIGWGRLYEDGPLPDVIQHVDVPIITNNECEKMYKNAGYVEEIPNMFICAGISKGGRDSCEGDSGGPLTMLDHDGRSYLVGIISWGIGCALPSQPGVYTRITAFSDWINHITAF